jgi:hypothetical protein
LAVRDFLANLPEHHVQRWIRHTLTVPDLTAIALNLTPFGNNDFNLIDHLPCFVLSVGRKKLCSEGTDDPVAVGYTFGSRVTAQISCLVARTSCNLLFKMMQLLAQCSMIPSFLTINVDVERVNDR